MNDEPSPSRAGPPHEAVLAATMQAVLAAASDAVITVDSEDRIVLFNAAAERMFGVSADEAVGGTVSRFIPEDRRKAHEGFVREYRLKGETSRRMGFSRPIIGLRADGREVPLEAWISRAEIGGEVLLTVVLRDISNRQAVEDARLQMLIAREIEHRAKNALAAVQALVSITTADTKEDLIRLLRSRIAAFARGYSLLVASDWQGVEFGRLAETELKSAAPSSQLRLSGPPVPIAPEAVQPLSLILHELATNALKYGALSRAGGMVDLSWRITPGPKLELVWIETGGPPIEAPPERQGFGSALLKALLIDQLKGELALDWRREGLAATVHVPPPAFRESGAPAAQA